MDNNSPKLGINLLVRNLENHLNMVLNDYQDVPIEMQRIVIENILEKITKTADQITKQELNEYQAALQKQVEETEKQEE